MVLLWGDCVVHAVVKPVLFDENGVLVEQTPKMRPTRMTTSAGKRNMRMVSLISQALCLALAFVKEPPQVAFEKDGYVLGELGEQF